MGGAYDAEAAPMKFVCDAFDQRSFGADNGEVNLQGWGKIGIASDSVGGSGDALGDLRDAGVAGAGPDARHVRRFLETPSEGVFAATAANNKYLHSLVLQLE